MLIYPLLLGLVVSVNVAGAVVARRLAFRGTVLCGSGLAALGALGFATFHAGTPGWQLLLFMALMGLGIGPALSGLQIALQRSVAPAQIGGAMGAMLLLRQVGGAVALAAAGAVYGASASGAPTAASSASATGVAVLAVGLSGSLIAGAALLALPRRARAAAGARSRLGGAPAGWRRVRAGQRRKSSAAATIASGASSCTRWPAPGTTRSAAPGIRRASSSPRSTGIHASSAPHRIETGQRSSP